MLRRSVIIVFIVSFIASLFLAKPLLAGTVRQKFQAAPPPPAGMALVYIYRVKASFGRTPKIMVDGDDVTKLPNNCYSYFYAAPGSHSIRTKWGFMAEIPEIEGVINVSPGGTYYVKLQGRKMAWGLSATKVNIDLKVVPESEVLYYVKKAKKFYTPMVETVGSGAAAAGLTEKSAKQVAKSKFEAAPPPPPGFALVYIYRPDCPPRLRGARIFIDGQKVAKLTNKAYTWFYVSEGSHALNTAWGSIYKGAEEVNKNLNIVAGESYYFRMSGTTVTNYSYDSHTSALDPVTANLAEKELPRIKKYVPAEVQQVQ